MIKISKQNNSLIVEGIDNVFYPNNGDNSYPLNSLIVVTDNSDMATFRSVATNDVLFSGLIEDITINGEAVTKDNIITKFDAVSNSTSTGGGGSVDAYTKTESDAKYATKDELTAVETVANNADTKADAATSRVESVETSLGNKQDVLVSGTNIKTVNSQSILGSGDLTISGVSDEQAQEIAKIPTLETELAQKANVSDVPTVQTGRYGTNKNYVYSEGDIDNYKGVMSKLEVGYSGEKDVLLSYHLWNSTASHSFPIPTATTSKAGVMSAADKTKLDSIPENIPTQTEVDNIAADVSALETNMTGKQDTLVSGTNIKTINNQSILGEGNIEITGGEVDLTNYYTKTEADGKFATITGFNEQAADISALQTAMDGKQATLVSGENIKTINGESVLGTGDIQISSEAKIYDAKEIKSTFNEKLNNCVNHLNTGEDYTENLYINSGDRAIYDNFFHNIKYGDIVLINKTSFYPYRLEYRGVNGGYYRFAVVLNDYDNLKNFTADISLRYTQNSDYLTFATNNGGPAAKISDVMAKQDTLVSGTNIKTINGNSILGEGNLVIEGGGIDLSNYYTKTETDTKLDTKQNTLVSGTNIKTVNSQSILGEGNIEVTIPDATTATSGAMSAADKTKLDSISNEWAGTQAEYDALTTKDNNIIYYVTE